MQNCHKSVAISLLTALTIFTRSYLALAHSGEPPPEADTLSVYWSPAVTRWQHIIVRYARERQVDPDLVAAIVWHESLGRATARGPTGAVGLMGLKPFEWRPSPEQLENPWTNLFWGTRTLAQIVRDGNGDLFYSLAAYNGGWRKIHLSATRRYAASVLGHYVRAVAARYGLDTGGTWIAILAVEGAPGNNTITVLGPHHPVARYTERLRLRNGIPVTPDATPHATAISFDSEQGVKWQVNVWLVTEEGALGFSTPHPMLSTAPSTSPSNPVYPLSAGYPFSLDH